MKVCKDNVCPMCMVTLGRHTLEMAHKCHDELMKQAAAFGRTADMLESEADWLDGFAELKESEIIH